MVTPHKVHFQKTYCLMILNYNGKKHLKDCLTTALEAVQTLGRSGSVIVVDNQSTEGDVGYIHSNFLQAEVIVAPKNDYLFSLNDAIAQRTEDIVIILNNDMRFDRNFIAPLLPHFENPEVFAVTAKTLNWNGDQITTGKRIGYFKHFWFYKKWDYSVQRVCLTLDAGGGYAAFRRSMFVELGGFDPLYRPGYCEDTDLSYRAWKRGWKVIYEPRSVIYHKTGATFDQVYDRSKTTQMILRNEVLFTIKNCGNSFFLLMYLLLLPLRAFRNFFEGNRPLTYGIFDAVGRMPLALLRRLQSIGKQRINDKQFFKKIKEDIEFPSLN